MNMNTLRMLPMLAALALPLVSRATDSVAPETVAFNSVRSEAQASISPTEFYRGSSLLMTNCVLYAGTSTNALRQGLVGVEIEVRVGTAEDNTAYTGNAASTNGDWYCTVTVPTNMLSGFVQVKLTDGGTNVYYYPWKTFATRSPLAD